MSSTALAIAFGPMPLGDAMLLRAGLRVAGIQWRTATHEACDVFFAVSPRDLPPLRCRGPRFVVAGPRRASSVPALFLDRWPHIGQIADVIARLRTSPPELSDAANTGTTVRALMIPIDHWLDEIARAETHDRLIDLATTSGATVLLDPVNRCAWLAPSATGRLADVLGKSPATLSSTARRAPSASSVRASLAHVLWALALAGRWQPDALGIAADRRLKLRRWPDFGSLERRDTFLRVASRLTREPTSLQALLAMHPRERDDVLAFLAGCRLCGWLEVTADIDDAPFPALSVASGRLQSAVDAIRRALGMRGAAQ